MRIASVVGARPQFVKLGMLDLAIRRAANDQSISLKHRILHTGQHYDENMSSVFFEELGIPTPDQNLGIGSCSHGVQTGRMLLALEATFQEEVPDLVLTYGDTNSTLAAALAASKLHIPVAHIESGLRSFRKEMAEEINRIVTDQVSSLLFCPTVAAIENLRNEGLDRALDAHDELFQLDVPLPSERATMDAPWIVNVGDVMYDSVLYHAERAEARGLASPELACLPDDYAVLTVHRAENTDDESRLRGILDAVARLADEGLPVVFPVHPRSAKAIANAGLEDRLASMIVLDPVPYYDALLLIRRAALVLTDSGGVQREAFMLGRPCVTLRDETEWVELLETGLSLLGGADEERILDAARRLLEATGVPLDKSPYGDGFASDRIVEACLAWGRQSGL
ncbi:UDP-N-acetyl glucosamine 2-epimerase [Candidatus Bipolaricaulota bacterium]